MPFAVEYVSIAHAGDRVIRLLRTSVFNGLLVSIEAVGALRTESTYGEDQDARAI